MISMKILHYVDENRLAWGETWIQLIKELAVHHVENLVVCKSGGTLEKRLYAEGVLCDTCDVPVACLPWTAPKLGRIISDFKPDIIHTRLSSAARIGGWWGKHCGVPVVSTIDKYPKAYYYKNSVAIIPCSTAVRDHMAKIGFKDSVMTVIHNPIDVKRYLGNNTERTSKRKELGIADDELVVLAAGRFVDWKGFEFVIKAFSELLKTHPDMFRLTRLCIVGDGPERQNYTNLINSLCLNNKIKLYPFAQDIRPWLWCADLFVQPSQEPEGFSLMLLEAMATGLPAIATAIGGTTDIICDGENGWLTRISDYLELSEKIYIAISQPESLKRIAKAAQNAAATFNVADIAVETINLYEKILTNMGRK